RRRPGRGDRLRREQPVARAARPRRRSRPDRVPVLPCDRPGGVLRPGRNLEVPRLPQCPASAPNRTAPVPDPGPVLVVVAEDGRGVAVGRTWRNRRRLRFGRAPVVVCPGIWWTLGE